MGASCTHAVLAPCMDEYVSVLAPCMDAYVSVGAVHGCVCQCWRRAWMSMSVLAPCMDEYVSVGAVHG